MLAAKAKNSITELAAPFKPAAATTLACRARKRGLGDAADAVLHGRKVELARWIRRNGNGKDADTGVATLAEVEAGVQAIIAEQIANDPACSQIVDTAYRSFALIRTVSVKSKGKGPAAGGDRGGGGRGRGRGGGGGGGGRGAKASSSASVAASTYADFSTSVRWIKPHQVLAINRAESAKELRVSIVLDAG